MAYGRALNSLAAFASFTAVLSGVSYYAYAHVGAERKAAMRESELACLAENVYYESRGEPLVGQYAVAEVTMNRVASPLFPDTVCGVVHSGHYAKEDGHYVGAFSWTAVEESLPAPYGYEWRRAMAVASTIYDNQEAPLVDGALYYHATYVTPDWARSRTAVARIGRHMFYL